MKAFSAAGDLIAPIAAAEAYARHGDALGRKAQSEGGIRAVSRNGGCCGQDFIFAGMRQYCAALSSCQEKETESQCKNAKQPSHIECPEIKNLSSD